MPDYGIDYGVIFREKRGRLLLVTDGTNPQFLREQQWMPDVREVQLCRVTLSDVCLAFLLPQQMESFPRDPLMR